MVKTLKTSAHVGTVRGGIHVVTSARFKWRVSGLPVAATQPNVSLQIHEHVRERPPIVSDERDMLKISDFEIRRTPRAMDFDLSLSAGKRISAKPLDPPACRQKILRLEG